MTSHAGVAWRHRLALAALPVVAAALAGATYQGVETAMERRALSHPGQLVDVGGHQLHLLCTGEGTPVVVLEAPVGAPSVAWAPVQSKVAEFTRVCSYDRAGLGWSESDANAYDPGEVPGQLRALLAASHTKGPYVLVGQGLGAALAQLWASQFADDVVGLVLVDTPEPGVTIELPSPHWWERRPALWPWLARFGLLRLTGGLAQFADRLQGPEGTAVTAFFHRPDHLSRTSDELRAWDQTVSLAAQAPRSARLKEIRVATANPTPLALLTDASAVERTVSAIRQASRRDRR